MKVIAVINQKGGVGKTTTALVTAQGLAKDGGRVLFIDLDPQQNASLTLGAYGHAPNSLDVVTGRAQIADAAVSVDGLDVIAASENAAQADLLIEGIGKEHRLEEALQAVAGAYDFAIIDTPPALGILTANALTAADTAVVPAQADVYSLEGIKALGRTIEAVRKYANPRLTVSGILLTRFNARTTLGAELRDFIAEAAADLGTTAYNATIREGVAVREAQTVKESLLDYAPRAKVTGDYKRYLDELKERLNDGEEKL